MVSACAILMAVLASSDGGSSNYIVVGRIVETPKAAPESKSMMVGALRQAARVVGADSNRQADKEASKREIQRLTMIAEPGKEVSFEQGEEQPFVTSVKRAKGAVEPKITVLREGLVVRFQITSIDGERVSLDGTVRETAISSGEERVVNAKENVIVQAPRLDATETRFLETVTLGEPTTISLGKETGRTFEFTVRRSE